VDECKPMVQGIWFKWMGLLTELEERQAAEGGWARGGARGRGRGGGRRG